MKELLGLVLLYVVINVVAVVTDNYLNIDYWVVLAIVFGVWLVIRLVKGRLTH